MSTLDMFKLWMIKEFGIPLLVIVFIFGGVLVWAIVSEICGRIKKRKS